MGADATAANLLLHCLRELAHQRQPPRHPARAAVDSPRQLLLVEPKARQHLTKQPALLDRRLRLGGPQRPAQQQGVDLAHLPHRGPDRVLPQTPGRAHPLVAVDHHVAAGRRARNHHDRHLLAVCRKRCQHTPLLVRSSHSKPLVPQLELVVLQVHALSRPPSGPHPQPGTGRISSCGDPPRSVRGSRFFPTPCERLSSCTSRIRSSATTAIQSVTCTPISSCMADHGSRPSAPPARIGSGRRGPSPSSGLPPAFTSTARALASSAALALRDRCWRYRSLKYSGLRPSQPAWLARRRSRWHSGRPHAFCRSPTRGSGLNQRRQIQHGLFFTMRHAATTITPSPAFGGDDVSLLGH